MTPKRYVLEGSLRMSWIVFVSPESPKRIRVNVIKSGEQKGEVVVSP